MKNSGHELHWVQLVSSIFVQKKRAPLNGNYTIIAFCKRSDTLSANGEDSYCGILITSSVYCFWLTRVFHPIFWKHDFIAKIHHRYLLRAVSGVCLEGRSKSFDEIYFFYQATCQNTKLSIPCSQRPGLHRYRPSVESPIPRDTYV